MLAYMIMLRICTTESHLCIMHTTGRRMPHGVHRHAMRYTCTEQRYLMCVTCSGDTIMEDSFHEYHVYVLSKHTHKKTTDQLLEISIVDT